MQKKKQPAANYKLVIVHRKERKEKTFEK